MAVKREQVIRQAEKLVSRGKIEAGIREYRKVLTENPNDVSTLNRVGDLYARLSRFDDAVRLFGQIAQQYTEDGFLVKGIAIYKKIIKLDPTRLEVYEKLAELYHRQGLLNEARTQYQVLADYYLKYDDRTAAINICEKMAEVEPDNPAHHLKLAELYHQEGMVEKAMGSYRTIAELLLRHDKADEAARAYQRAIELRPEDVSFITEAVVGLKDGGNIAAAAKLLTAAVELNPEAQRVAKLAGISEAKEAEEIGAEPPAPDSAPAPSPLPETPDPEPQPPPPAPATSGWGDPEPAAFSGDQGSELVLDLDEEPSSLVPPPPDMVRPGSAFQENFELDPAALELDLGDLPDLPGPEPTETSEAAEGEGEPAAGPIGELDVELELELPQPIEWDLEEEATPAASTDPAADRPAEPPPRPFLPPAQEPPPPPPPPAPPRVQDLIAEAEVFAKYGLEDKARERLSQVLEQEPERLEAHRLLFDLHLAAGEHGKAEKAAERVRDLSAAQGKAEVWAPVQRQLERAGISLPGEPPTAAPTPGGEDRISNLLRSLGESPERAGRRVGEGKSVDQVLADLASEMRVKPSRVPAPPPPADAPTAGSETVISTGAESPPASEPALTPPPAPAAPAEPPPPPAAEPPALEPRPAETSPAPPPLSAPRPSLDELDLDAELPGIVLPEERKPESDLDDTGMDWLTEAPREEEGTGEERLFEDEEQFFDLAAELEEELGQEEARQGKEMRGQPEEPSLEEIVEGFKRGVAENLSPEDFDTHYNLGIAYREMGLLDEAIGEFQVAAKDPGHLVECCAMLGVCFLEKGLPELAIKWYQRGLSAPDIGEETTLSMLYDMGNVYLSVGDTEAARKTFVELYGMSSHYRDVVAKLEELGR